MLRPAIFLAIRLDAFDDEIRLGQRPEVIRQALIDKCELLFDFVDKGLEFDDDPPDFLDFSVPCPNRLAFAGDLVFQAGDLFIQGRFLRLQTLDFVS